MYACRAKYSSRQTIVSSAGPIAELYFCLPVLVEYNYIYLVASTQKRKKLNMFKIERPSNKRVYIAVDCRMLQVQH